VSEPTDTVQVPREVARRALMSFMSDLSEDCWCATWLGGTERDLWHMMQAGGGDDGAWQVSREQAALLRTLADALQEWPSGFDPWETGWLSLQEAAALFSAPPP
jgi:hypothetical protein